MEKSSKIYIAGHTGLVGSAIMRNLVEKGYNNFCNKSHSELDLRNQMDVNKYFELERPEYVFMAAAKVGGVYINDKLPATFMYDNLAISMNVIHSAYKFGIKKLLFMGSGCIYPKSASQPIKESYLLTGELEKTNEAYALAKISGIKMCEFYNKQYGTDFISCMPCNAYGPGDSFDLEASHVIPAMIRKFHEAKKEKKESVVIWGSGTPIREFIYIDDIASGCVFLMERYSGNECINIGTGVELTIRELADIIKQIVGYEGEIEQDLSKPDGTSRKLLDSSKIFSLGWKPQIDFESGIRATYQDYINNFNKYL